MVDAYLDVAAKNGESFPARSLKLNRAWIHFHAMDFGEVIATGEVAESSEYEFGNAYLVRMSRLLTGAAYVALGDRERGVATLAKARAEMNSHLIVFDWCFRLFLHAAMTEYWLAEGDLIQARNEARLYSSLALKTESFTYAALALEVSAPCRFSREKPHLCRDFRFWRPFARSKHTRYPWRLGVYTRLLFKCMVR